MSLQGRKGWNPKTHANLGFLQLFFYNLFSCLHRYSHANTFVRNERLQANQILHLKACEQLPVIHNFLWFTLGICNETLQEASTCSPLSPSANYKVLGHCLRATQSGSSNILRNCSKRKAKTAHRERASLSKVHTQLEHILQSLGFTKTWWKPDRVALKVKKHEAQANAELPTWNMKCQGGTPQK